MVKFLWKLLISENTIYLKNMLQTIIIYFDSIDLKSYFLRLRQGLHKTKIKDTNKEINNISARVVCGECLTKVVFCINRKRKST